MKDLRKVDTTEIKNLKTIHEVFIWLFSKGYEFCYRNDIDFNGKDNFCPDTAEQRIKDIMRNNSISI